MEEWIGEALSQWTKEGIEINPGVDISDIEKIENKIGYKFPDDFLELYSNINGFKDFECRGFMLSLWSLERIEADYDVANKFIMLGDFSLSVCQYGFDKKNTGIFKTYSHHQVGPVEFIAKSFREAVALFNTDSQLLF